MKGNSIFQIAILAIFAVFAVIGVIFFASQKNSSGQSVDVEVWGTEDQSMMDSVIGNAIGENEIAKISYVQKGKDSFNEDLVEAIAENRGPDLIILDDADIIRHKEKISLFPFESISERQYSDAFIDGSFVFWTPEGFVGLPFSVDPIVMYWNKSMFINEGIIRAPSYWDEFANLSIKLTKKDTSLNISKSLVAFGEYNNVNNAKGILSMLMMQSGTPIVAWGGGGKIENYLSLQDRSGLRPTDTALRFYTEFADPRKSTYSWNRSLPNSQKAFISGDLAIYFGFASEVESIRNANPNLNFDVAVVPQVRDAVEKSTYGKFKAVSVLKSASDYTAAYGVASMLASSDVMVFMTDNSTLPPVGKTVIENKPQDPYKVVFYDSALISRSWLDPDKGKTSVIFRDMVSDITSGRARLSESINNASDIMNTLIR